MGMVVGASFIALYSTYAIANYYGSQLLARGEIEVQDLFQAIFAIIYIGVGE